ncbi:MAG: alkaline phosphatase D family protein [Bdellovibrionota bacterium]
MIFNRRDFIKGTAVLGTALLTKNAFSFTERFLTDHRFPVLQGATSFSKTQINILAAEDIVVSVPLGKVSLTVVEKPYSIWKAYRVVVENLSPDTRYDLQICSPDGVLLSTRYFSTLTPDKTKAKIALISCTRDTKAEFQAPMWQALVDSNPDLIFLLGDNVYVDDETTEIHDPLSEVRLWRRYVETRLTLDLFHMPELIPTLATWDDHDYGLNNAYGETPYRVASTHVFKTLFAQDAIMPEVTWGPGVAVSFSAYGQRFYLMDSRSFRTEPLVGKEHWGSAQDEWMLGSLSTSHQPGWILSGSQIFGGYREGWGFEKTHPELLKKILSRLSKIEAPVLFGSGDVHYSEIMKIESELLGYETFEITSSSMHSKASEPRDGNFRRLASTGEYNFVIAHVEVRDQSLIMDLHSHGRDNKQFFEVNNIRIGRSF